MNIPQDAPFSIRDVHATTEATKEEKQEEASLKLPLDMGRQGLSGSVRRLGSFLGPPAHMGQGSWMDATFHMVTAVPTPSAVFALPYTFASLGWYGGTASLIAGGVVTFYTSRLLASLNTFGGQRHARYRDLVYDIWGLWGSWTVLGFQLIVNLGSLISIALPAGLGLQFVYNQYSIGGPPLQVWIIIFSCLQILLSMLPNLQTLRGVNALSAFCVVSMSAIAFGLSLHDGTLLDRSTVSYAVVGTTSTKVFSVFNAIAATSFAYGNTMLVEIQATVKDPPVSSMYKVIVASYMVIVPSFFCVALAGYWAFGNSVQSYLLFSLTKPRWLVTVANLAAVIQFVASYQFYCQLIFEYFETKYGDPTKGHYARRNLVNRVMIRSVLIIFVGFVSCALPFFGDFVALVGAAGFTPMDFVLPLLLYIKVHNQQGWQLGVNALIAATYTLVGLAGCIGAIRYIIVDAINYHVFANVYSSLQQASKQ